MSKNEGRARTVTAAAKPKAYTYGKQTLLTALLWLVSANPVFAMFGPRWGIWAALAFGAALGLVGALCLGIGWVQQHAQAPPPPRDSTP